MQRRTVAGATRRVSTKARQAPKRLPEVTVKRLISMVPRVTIGLPLTSKRVLWRNLVTRFPGDSALAAEYALAMLRSESWDDLAAFEAAARKHKSAEIDFIYVDVDLAKRDVAGAERRLAAIERREGRSTSTLWRRYDLQFMAQDFDAAIEVARQLLADSPTDRRWAGDLVRKAEFYRGLRRKWSAPLRQARDYDLYVVNLDADTVRMERMSQQLAGMPFTRIPGVKGAYLPSLFLDEFTSGSGSGARGTAGCFLSHLATWERVVRAGRPALVLEDDAWILAGLPRGLSDVRLPADFDYCFAAESFLPSEYDYRRKTFDLVHPRDVLPTKPAHWDTPTTVAYFISPAGANKLLDRVKDDRAAGDVDWRILAYSLNAKERQATIRQETAASRLLGIHHRFVGPGRRPLHSYVLVPGLARNFEAGSVRLHDNGVTPN